MHISFHSDKPSEKQPLILSLFRGQGNRGSEKLNHANSEWQNQDLNLGLFQAEFNT